MERWFNTAGPCFPDEHYLRSILPWEQRLTTRTLEANGKRVHVVGC